MPKKASTKRPTSRDDNAKAQGANGGSKRLKTPAATTTAAAPTNQSTMTLPPAAAAATAVAVAASLMPPPAADASLMSPTPAAAAAAADDTTTPNKAAKQPNFTASEEWVLCQSYLYHTQDSRVGTGQTAAAFKDKVYETFKQVAKTYNIKVYDRSASSLDTKFGRIKKSVTKFMAILRSIKSKKPSGKTEQDMENDALAEYKDKHGHAFKLLAVLPILQRSPKFNDEFIESVDRNLKEGEVVNQLSLPQGAVMERPAGRDLAKRAAVDAASFAASFQQHQEGVVSLANAVVVRTKQSARACDLQRIQAALLHEHKMYMQMENFEEAQRVMAEIRAMNAKAVEETAALPDPPPPRVPTPPVPVDADGSVEEEGKQEDDGIAPLNHLESEKEEEDDSDDDVLIDRERGGTL
jgi:hypothetical protein